MDEAVDIGEERLGRSSVDIFITAFIGGVEVSLGELVAASILGSFVIGFPRLGLYGGLALAALIFPAAFVFVIVGRSELFTENFLIPVVAVLTREQPPTSLLQVWGLSWLGNIIASALMALLFLVPDAVGSSIEEGFRIYADYKLNMPGHAVFVSGVLAGMVMSVLTWLLIAMRSSLGKLVIIYLVGYTIFATNLSHVVVSATLIFVGFGPSHHSIVDVLIWLAIATAGNLVGGVGLVTLYRMAQVWESRRES